ncbi:hypothetical protein Fmac_024398 [Flemingia macrophylla]|uniref:Uncharacterized protein n=1 Tax=Flemingia macrophylla TaxID=520843 RepID=A0ABD1LR15_9FABA
MVGEAEDLPQQPHWYLQAPQDREKGIPLRVYTIIHQDVPFQEQHTLHHEKEAAYASYVKGHRHSSTKVIENKAMLNVSLTGQVRSRKHLDDGTAAATADGTCSIGSTKVHAPVSIKLGRLKLRKVSVLGECMLVVDSSSSNNLVSIKASNCKFRMKL